MNYSLNEWATCTDPVDRTFTALKRVRLRRTGRGTDRYRQRDACKPIRRCTPSK